VIKVEREHVMLVCRFVQLVQAESVPRHKLMTDGDPQDKVEAFAASPPASNDMKSCAATATTATFRSTARMRSRSSCGLPFGPNKLMYRLRFEDGLLVDVDTLSPATTRPTGSGRSRSPTASHLGRALAGRSGLAHSLLRRPKSRAAARPVRARDPGRVPERMSVLLSERGSPPGRARDIT
jgi:hypothetical protein